MELFKAGISFLTVLSSQVLFIGGAVATTRPILAEFQNFLPVRKIK
jgi:hypothetical protein